MERPGDRSVSKVEGALLRAVDVEIEVLFIDPRVSAIGENRRQGFVQVFA
jgi:hypothetical protein